MDSRLDKALKDGGNETRRQELERHCQLIPVERKVGTNGRTNQPTSTRIINVRVIGQQTKTSIGQGCGKSAQWQGRKK
jgi:hypothetical protein